MIEDQEKTMERDIGYISAKVESIQSQVDQQVSGLQEQIADLHAYIEGHMDKEDKKFTGIHRWQYGLIALVVLQWSGFTGPEALKVFIKILG